MKDLIDKYNNSKSRIYTSYNLSNEKDKQSQLIIPEFKVIKIDYDIEKYFKKNNITVTESILECNYSTIQQTVFDYIKTTLLKDDLSLKQILDINPKSIPQYIQKTYKKKHTDIKSNIEEIILKFSGNNLYSGKTNILIELISKKEYKKIVIIFRLKQSQDMIETILKESSVLYINILPYKNCQVLFFVNYLIHRIDFLML